MNVERSSQHTAVVLRISSFGESHAMVDLLTQESGLVPSTAYGLRSRRSSLRGKVVPFARGEAWLYHDPRRERSKITDFAVDRYAVSLQTNLTAYYHANLWAEVVWRTHASGEFGPEVFELFVGGLDALEALGTRADSPRSSADLEHRARAVGTAFAWRYVGILGVRPDITECSSSGRQFAPEDVRYFDRAESVFVGREWADRHMATLHPGAAAFLLRTAAGPLRRDLGAEVSRESLAEARGVALTVLQDAVAVPINTLAVAGGLL